MDIALKPWTERDAAMLHDLMQHIDRRFLSNRIPDPYTLKDAESWLSFVGDHEGRDALFRSIVVDGRCAGTVSAEQRGDVYCRDAEVGYFLRTDLWGRSVMTKALGLFCSEAFAALDIVRLSALVYEPNRASRRVLEKNGFMLEGMLRQAVYKDGHTWNAFVLGRLKGDQAR